MKKQIRSRNKNSNSKTNLQNDTKASSRKPHNKIIKKKPILPKILPPSTLCPNHSTSDEALKNQSEEITERSTDISSNVNIQDYLDDINCHIINVDKEFHSIIYSGLLTTKLISVSKQMRKILIRWLVKVTLKFKMKQESLHTCIQLIDFMLIHHSQLLNKSNFQLLGIAALFISCKYNQIYTLEAEKYIELCDGLYSLEQLFEMQSIVLMKLQFNLQIPTLSEFMKNFIYKYNIESQQENLINTIINLALFDFNVVNSYRKYDLAVTIVYLSTKLQKLDGMKEQLGILKAKICPQTFRKCFIAVMSLFKKHTAKINDNIN